MASIFNYLMKASWREGINVADEAPIQPSKDVNTLLSRPRTRPMKVLCLSACRTSEAMLKSGLSKLGYHVFGIADATKDPQLLLGAWKGAVDYKYHLDNPDIEKGQPGSESAPRKWGRKEFDGMMSQYDACAGVPTCLFIDDLLDAYPDTKVILSVRDKREWAESMTVAAGQMISWRGWDWMIRHDRAFSGPLIGLIKSQMAVMTDWPRLDFDRNGHAERWFEGEQAKIRARVPKSRLLEWRAGTTSWDEVCRFLEVEPPKDKIFTDLAEDEDDKSIVKFQKTFWWIGVTRVIAKLSSIYVGAPVIAWLIWRRHDAVHAYIRQIVGSAKPFLRL